MTHDVDELRRDLADYAEQAEFQVSWDAVRARAGRQRARRALLVTGVAVIAALALAAPVALNAWQSPDPSPAPAGSLPAPEKGWRQVDGPISTGLPGNHADAEIVLWFERRDNGVTRLMSGERDEATGEVTTPAPFGSDTSSTGEMGRSKTPGGGGFYAPPGDWSWSAFSQDVDGMRWGLFIGNAEKIEVMSRKEGKQVARPAKLARLSEDPRFVAYWVDGLGERTDDSLENPAVRAYDPDGNLLPMNLPIGRVPPAEGQADFDLTSAPRLGDWIRTGEERKPDAPVLPGRADDDGGEVVLSFHGKDGYAGLVTELRDRDTGKLSHRHGGTLAYKLPFTENTDIERGEMPLGGSGGHTMAYGVVVGSVDRITAKVDELELPVKTARWPEDPRVVVWWVVIPTDQVEEDSAQAVKLTIHHKDGTVSHE